MDWGAVIAGGLGGGANAVGQIADEQISQQNKIALFQQQKELEVQKAQLIEDMKRGYAAQDRSRVSATMKQGFDAYDAANPQAPGTTPGDFTRMDRGQTDNVEPTGPSAPVNSRARMRAGIDQLALSGDSAHAEAYRKLLDAGNKTVASGAQIYDDDGKLIADNNAQGAAAAKLMTAQARGLAAQGAADRGTAALQQASAKKPLDEKTLLDLSTRADKWVEGRMGHAVDPFSPVDVATGKPARDEVKIQLTKSVLQQGVEDAAARGEALPVGQSLAKIEPLIKQADFQVRREAMQVAAKLFDEKGKPIPGVVQQLQANPGDDDPPPAALHSRAAFMKWYRDTHLEGAFTKALLQGAKAKPRSASTQATASPADNGMTQAPDANYPAPTEQDVQGAMQREDDAQPGILSNVWQGFKDGVSQYN